MNPGCFYSESYDPDTKIEITIKTMKAIIDETESMIYWVKFPKFFLGIVVAMCVIEFFMVFMHRNEALSKQGYDKFLLIRRGISFFFMGFALYCFWGIYAWSGHEPVEVLAANKCTNDVILQETFINM